MKPRLLDLFAGGQGAGVGYARAGFEVHAVDIAPHAKHPEVASFTVGDAMEVLADAEFCRTFDVIHASPPCQTYSAMTNCRPGLAEEYPDLIDPTRERLRESGVPWVMENVAGSGLPEQSGLFGEHGIRLCGAMFGLPLYRHRLFETSEPMKAPHHPRHLIPASRAGHWEPGTVISVSGNCSPIELARAGMGIDWMNRDALAEAIPPAYTTFIGGQLITALDLAGAA